jgi:hypothetical protein
VHSFLKLSLESDIEQTPEKRTWTIQILEGRRLKERKKQMQTNGWEPPACWRISSYPATLRQQAHLLKADSVEQQGDSAP